MLWFHSLDGDSFSGNCACDQECSSFNPVGDHPVFRAVQIGHTFDDDSTRSRAFDLGAHFIQERCKVYDLGLLRSPFNYCHTIGQNGSHHHVISTEDGWAEFTLHIDNRPAQFWRKNLDVAAFHAHRCAERFETSQMQINWPVTDDTTAGQSNGRLLAPAQ